MGLFDTKKDAPVNPAVAECDRQIAEFERRKTNLIMAIGSKYLELNTFEAAIGTPYEQYLREMQDVLASRSMLETRKLAVQGLRRCEKCGNVLVLDSMFCNKCGTKLEPIAQQNTNPQPEAAPVQPVCPVCGKVCDVGASFCTTCGTKLNA